MGCSPIVFLEKYFLCSLFPKPSYCIRVLLWGEGLATPDLNCPHKWVYYSIISKLMLSLLDLLKVPPDVTFETFTAELMSLLLEEKNWISDWLKKLKIKFSCWFVLSPFWGRKMVGLGCLFLQMVLESFVLCPCFQEQCRSCRCLPFWTPDVFLFWRWFQVCLLCV